MSKAVLGIDIGDFSIKCVEIKKDKVVSFKSIELPENMVADGEILSVEAMAEFLKNTVKKQFKTRDVAVVIPDNVTYIRRLKFPSMTVAQLKVNLPFEFHDVVKDEPDKFSYDYSVVNAGSSDSQLEVIAAAIRTELVDKYQEIFKKAGFRIVMLSPRELSIGPLIETVSPIETGKDYATIDIGYKVTRIDIFKGGIYDLTRTIDVGTEDLEKVCCDVLKCEKRMAKFHIRDNTKDILNMEESYNVYESISVEVMRCLRYYSYENPNNSLESIYIYGGGAKVKQFSTAIESLVPLSVIDLSTYVSKYNMDNSLGDGFSATAIGLTYGGAHGK
ncbi:MAG: pilus assembly protein PilM [Saccharofermentans sp.]|nr:pilus assembly protein PilM [Saccharofermentans sp.]